MQLIVEPEATLDIEKTMSAVENIQNKVENLETGDFTNKCNGDKQVLDKKDDDKTEMFNEIEATLAIMHADVQNNDAELSNVDLSEIISEQNSHVDKDVQIKESQNNSLDNDTNGIEADKKENVKESKEILEEDYLEDDIISISEEPFREILQPGNESINVVLEKDKTSTEPVLKNKEDKTETLQMECQPIIKDKDVNEVFEETENTLIQAKTEIEPHVQEENEKVQVIEKPLIEDTDIIEVLEETENIPIEAGKEIEPPMQEENEEVQVIENTENSLSQCGSKAQPQEDDDIELIEESAPVDSPVQREVENGTMDDDSNKDAVKTETSITSENITNLPRQELKHDNIAATEEIKDISSEIENKEVLPEKEDKDQVQIIEEVEEKANQSENKTDSDTHEPKKDKCEVKLDITAEKDDVELIEDSEKPSNLCENADSPTGVEITSNEIESKENQEMHIDDTPNSPISKPTVEVTNIDAADSPIVLKDDAMEDEEAKNISAPNDAPIELKDDMDVEEIADTSNNKVTSEAKDADNNTAPTNTAAVNNIIDKPIICKLFNTLDILSDDEEEELPKVDLKSVSPKVAEVKENQSINIEDDDDIMLIDEDTNKTEPNVPEAVEDKTETVVQADKEKDTGTGEKTVAETNDLFDKKENEESTPPVTETKATMEIDIKEKTPEPIVDKIEPPPPLIPDNFVKTAKKKLSDMTRDELEEFCILKIVESIVDRGSLTDIKNKLISMSQALDEHRKKATMLTKQNRDLQVVLKSVQEEQKKATGNMPITPLKITRSVGMQVFMEKTAPRKKGPQQNMNNKNVQNRNMMQGQGPRAQKQPNQNIPVPRLVPAHNPALKTPNTVPQISQMNTPTKANPVNGIIKNTSPVIKAEKRQFSKIGSGSVTVDLTDDEPPAKMPGGPKTSPAQSVRLIPPQNLMSPRFGGGVNSPRKVYIPISGPQNQTLRPGQTIMLKTVPSSGIRTRCPTPQVTRVDTNAMRLSRIAPRHPAPLPFAMKQYQPPNWKALPPPPDLKLSKVENGIVISWRIDDIPEDSYEEIASYQLYAYQETSLPPSTGLWKKIGDVKALPLPMACTLTQFMAGYKYYFAVRAVDIRSRLGPFSLPGSILLLSKNI